LHLLFKKIDLTHIFCLLRTRGRPDILAYRTLLVHCPTVSLDVIRPAWLDHATLDRQTLGSRSFPVPNELLPSSGIKQSTLSSDAVQLVGKLRVHVSWPTWRAEMPEHKNIAACLPAFRRVCCLGRSRGSLGSRVLLVLHLSRCRALLQTGDGEPVLTDANHRNCTLRTYVSRLIRQFMFVGLSPRCVLPFTNVFPR
jgi:hypothetical protein